MGAIPGKTELCNAALGHLKQAPVIDADGDYTSAIEFRRFFDIERRAILRAYPWKFNQARVELPVDPDLKPPFGRTSGYLLPADCLGVRHILNLRRCDWEPENRSILADSTQPLKVIYGVDHQDWVRFDPICYRALGLTLALAMGSTVGDLSTSRAQLINEMYREAIQEAYRLDAIDGPPETYGDQEGDDALHY